MGHPHPAENARKLCGGGGGNQVLSRERRAVVRGVRLHFPRDSWSRLSRRLAAVNGIILSDKTIKKWCMAESTLVTTIGRPTGDDRYEPAFIAGIVRHVVGDVAEEKGEDRENSHSIKQTMRWLRQRGGQQPGRTSVRRWVKEAGFSYKWRTKGRRLNEEHKAKRREMKEECDEEKRQQHSGRW